jgi:hypothetical protein
MTKLELIEWIRYGPWALYTATTLYFIIEWSLFDDKSLQRNSYSSYK